MKCALSWCQEERRGIAFLCAEHSDVWWASGEFKRFLVIAEEDQSGDHLPLHDFIRRLEAERRTHVAGGGK